MTRFFVQYKNNLKTLLNATSDASSIPVTKFTIDLNQEFPVVDKVLWDDAISEVVKSFETLNVFEQFDCMMELLSELNDSISFLTYLPYKNDRLCRALWVVRDDMLNCEIYNEDIDYFSDVPRFIAECSILCVMFASQLELEPGQLEFNFSNAKFSEGQAFAFDNSLNDKDDKTFKMISCSNKPVNINNLSSVEWRLEEISTVIA